MRRKAARRRILIRKYRKPKSSYLAVIIALILFTGLIVFLVLNNYHILPKAALTVSNTLDELINTRGDHAGYADRLAWHQITLADPMGCCYSWGKHSQETGKTGGGSINAWIVAERDVSQMGTALNARVAIKNMRMYVHKPGDGWVQGMDGMPSWMVSSNPETSGSYVDIGHNVEADGSWSFDFPVNRALHMSQNAPGLVIASADGVATVVEAKVIGPDAALTKWGMNSGADWRDASGGGSGIFPAAGLGRFGLLTGEYKTFVMLSSVLTDDQVRSNPPPTFTTGTTILPTPTPTPTQSSTQPIVTTGSFAAQYFNNMTLSGTPIYSNTVNSSSLNYTWSGSPAAGVNADQFSARYTGSFSFNSATYKFNATSDDGVRLYVDGQLIIDAWKNQAPTAYSGSKALPAGNHTVTVEYYDNCCGAVLAVNWAQVATPTPTPTPTPIPPAATASNIFNAQYYNNITLGGSPVVQNTTQAINYSWGTGQPLAGVTADNFSARWTGSFDFAAGSYTFTATADDGIRVWVDGVKTLDKWIDQGPTTYSFIQNFANAGAHTIVVEYYDHCCGAVAKFGWASSVASVSPIALEAENMQLLAGTYIDSSNNIFTDLLASGFKGRALYSNGTMTGQIGSAITKVTVRAKADVCDTAPHMVVKVDNVIVLQTAIGTKSWTDYTAAVSITPGTHAISVSFDNDGWTACDRNLRVDKVTIQ